ncbi:MAG: hypothetical protein US63_C0006G0010 [Candidatus Moranbacteria bacterium GW2011_GWC2_37_8]|nr:MAG: hypothetical protein US63_C0006G0010 [Candidatus Moranbacteria bacterium GW2011_GWC2_37_8]KKQ62436.1 MAG: hypothetical protein US82_C0011G0010 [Parcubacteria group bacterium GW2011_GWC1_38_22]KKQ80294.1 MAG: hypothetical protein UT03_C0028G0010 [Candidatus Moranbacteria bacterium GW2011_GWD2_38_7]
MNVKNKLGFYSSISTVVLTLITFGIAILTPPFSGPYCKGSCFVYPYLDIASRFPRDYYWIFPAMFLMIAYLVLMVCIHRWASGEKKIYSQIGLYFALMSAFVLISDYFVQLSVIQPSLLNGETDGISMLTQYNPHGIFIVLEELGFIFMSVSFLFLAFVFSDGKLQKAIRWTFASAFVLTAVAFIAYSTIYGLSREYRFEVASISINWLALIVSGILLAVIFNNEKK